MRLARVAPFPPPPLSPVPRPRLNPLGCCAAPSHPSSRVYTPPGRQQPCGAGPLDPHPSWGPFCAASTGRSPPAPAPHSCAASYAVLVPSGLRVVLATRPSLSRPLVVLWGVVCFFFSFSPCFFPRGSPLPACEHKNTASPSVSVPFGAHVLSHRHPVARPLLVPGHARWALLPRDVFLLFLLSTLSSPLSPARPLSVVLLLRVLAPGRPRAMVVSRALSQASGLPPCLLTCRPTWAAPPDTPSGGLPHHPPPPAAPPSVP